MEHSLVAILLIPCMVCVHIGNSNTLKLLYAFHFKDIKKSIMANRSNESRYHDVTLIKRFKTF